jgi:hypothetical protein
MKAYARIAATLFALVGAVVFGSPDLASAQNDNNQQNGDNGNNGNVGGAPGPIAGAGLPILAVGFGVYWLIKRRRKGK